MWLSFLPFFLSSGLPFRLLGFLPFVFLTLGFWSLCKWNIYIYIFIQTSHQGRKSLGKHTRWRGGVVETPTICRGEKLGVWDRKSRTVALSSPADKVKIPYRKDNRSPGSGARVLSRVSVRRELPRTLRVVPFHNANSRQDHCGNCPHSLSQVPLHFSLFNFLFVVEWASWMALLSVSTPD